MFSISKKLNQFLLEFSFFYRELQRNIYHYGLQMIIYKFPRFNKFSYFIIFLTNFNIYFPQLYKN